MLNASSSYTSTRYKPVLFWYGLGALTWIIMLLYAGGFTTTIRAGMAFLDWPLSNGSLNPDGWLENEDMMAEHSHRLLGAVMGILTLGLCAMAYLTKASKRIRSLGFALVFLVIFQGVLGGLRVKLDQLNLEIDHNLYAQSFAVAHGTLAQLFLCALVAFVVMSSRSWIENKAGFKIEPSRSLGTIGLAVCVLIILQLIVGAIMRHAYAGLAITTFPLTPQGTFIPTAFDFQVAIHFAHRVGALIVTIATIAYSVVIFKNQNYRKAVGISAGILLALLCLQVFLGALTIWTVRNPHVTTFHMLNGAATLAVAWMITYRSFRHRIEPTDTDATELANQDKPDGLAQPIEA